MKEKRSVLLGARVQMLRKKRGMTLEKLAARAATSKGYLSGLENAKVGPGTDRMIRTIAAALRVNPEGLLALAYLDRAPIEVCERRDFRAFIQSVTAENGSVVHT